MANILGRNLSRFILTRLVRHRLGDLSRKKPQSA